MSQPDATEPDDPYRDFYAQLARDQRQFAQRQARGRRVALAFLPFYVAGGLLFAVGAGRVGDRTTRTLLFVALLLILLGQWGQPYWLEYLHRRHGDDRPRWQQPNDGGPT